MTTNKRVCVGDIGAPHGVRGLVKVRHFGGDPRTLADYETLYTSEQGNDVIRLTLKHPAGNSMVAEIEGINDRDRAAALTGSQLWVDREALPELDNPDQYYYADLIGLSVLSPAGERIGHIISIENFGAGDLLEIKPPGKASFYLPFDQSYVTVDLNRQIIIADLPEGIME